MLTVERVRELLDYDPETGEFRWKVVRKGTRGLGSVAGYHNRTSDGKRYTLIGIDGKMYHAHRLVWLYCYGNLPEEQLDHINGNGTDNRMVNLRPVTNTENGRNTKRSLRNTSGVTGVYRDTRCDRWYAQIRVDGSQIHLGYCETFDDAVAVRKAAELKYGFHPNHGSDRPL